MATILCLPRALLLTALSVAGAATAAAPQSALAPQSSGSGELVLGRVSDDPKEDHEKLRVMLDYVVARMTDVGISSGRVLMARDNQQMVSYLRRGKVDWLTETPGSAMTFKEHAGAQILLLTERGGLARYQSVLFARVDSGIRTLADLRGRSIAFQNSASTSAYFLPAAEILNAGLPLAILASPSDRPSADIVGFVFARSELNISTWVHKGLADAGAFSEQDWIDPDRMPEDFRKDIVVFHRSPSVPRGMEVVRGDLDPRVRDRLHGVLLAAANDPAARPAMRAFWAATRFVDIDQEAARALETMRKGVARIRAEVE